MDKNISTQLENVPTEIYRGTKVMKSTDLHKFIVHHTGKYEKLSSFHRKIREVLEDQLDVLLKNAKLRGNGHVKYYRLDGVQYNMVVGYLIPDHLQAMIELIDKENSTSFFDFMTKIPIKSKSTSTKPRRNTEEELAQVAQRIKDKTKEVKLDDKVSTKPEAGVVNGTKINLPCMSLTTLLKKYGRKEYAHEINIILENMGYVEYVNRIYVITGNADYYGENIISGNKLLPKYYVIRFKELLEEIGSYISR
jgi:hypothetical protein